jgi:hypothetical protein
MYIFIIYIHEFDKEFFPMHADLHIHYSLQISIFLFKEAFTAHTLTPQKK